MKSECQTRQDKIDLQLGRAGWSSGSRQLISELLVENIGFIRNEPNAFRALNEFVDYALFDRLGRLLAIVEAKRSSRDPLVGERQAADYADALRAKYGVDPFVFLANGDEIWFWHRNLYPPRKVKFWQMLGRGTRTWTDDTDPNNPIKKDDFLVIDHWDNFDYFQVNKDGRAGAVSEPLPSRLLRLRLEKLQILAGRSDAPSVAPAIRQLRDLVGTLPLENINVAPHAEEIRTLSSSDEPWHDLNDERISHLTRKEQREGFDLWTSLQKA